MYAHNLDLNKDDNIFLSLVLEKVVLVKIISMVKTAYDPLSTSQTSRLKELITKLRNTYPTLTGSSKQVKELLTSVIDKFKASIGKLPFLKFFILCEGCKKFKNHPFEILELPLHFKI